MKPEYYRNFPSLCMHVCVRESEKGRERDQGLNAGVRTLISLPLISAFHFAGVHLKGPTCILTVSNNYHILYNGFQLLEIGATAQLIFPNFAP